MIDFLELILELVNVKSRNELVALLVIGGVLANLWNSNTSTYKKTKSSYTPSKKTYKRKSSYKSRSRRYRR